MFAPQLGGCFLATACTAVAMHFGTACLVASVPLWAWAVGSAAISLVTAIVKADAISSGGWDAYDKRGCSRCLKLRAELDDTRRALVELQS